MNTTTNAIQTTGLIKHRGDFTLGPLDLEVPRGFVTGIVGANGSGKTTTLRTLLGLMHADAGTIEMPPMDAVGIAFDQPFVLPDWRVKDAAEAYASFRPGWDHDYADAVLRRFRIQPTQRVKDLSRGESNKLMVALALGNHPEVLVLDEPTSGLDPAARADFVDLLRDYMSSEDATLLFSTHITSDLEHFADYLILIENGQIAYQGAFEQLQEEYAYVYGDLDDLTVSNTSLVRGLRKGQSSFDGVINTDDSAAFGAGIHIETPTLEQIAIHLARANGSEASR